MKKLMLVLCVLLLMAANVLADDTEMLFKAILTMDTNKPLKEISDTIQYLSGSSFSENDGKYRSRIQLEGLSYDITVSETENDTIIVFLKYEGNSSDFSKAAKTINPFYKAMSDAYGSPIKEGYFGSNGYQEHQFARSKNGNIDTTKLASATKDKGFMMEWDNENSSFVALGGKVGRVLASYRLEISQNKKDTISHSSASNTTDLKALNYDELVSLKDQINKAIWESQEWQEVTVPQGVWKVGKDIPAGHWIIKCADINRDNLMMASCQFEWGDKLDNTGKSISWSGSRWQTITPIYNPNSKYYEAGQATSYEWDAKNGDYIVINSMYAPAIFTPYNGKPSLGFK